MGEFCTANAVSDRLEQMIAGAEQWLVLISPFLITNQALREHLTRKLGKDLEMWLVCGKSQMNTGEEPYWRQHRNLHLGFLENLHAKCYMSERAAIVTSMHLTDFTQRNEHEMGIVLTREKDKSLYDSVVKYAGKMIALSEVSVEAKEAWVKAIAAPLIARARRTVISPVRKAAPVESVVIAPEPSAVVAPRRETVRTDTRRNQAHCIRCNAIIKPNAEWPFCREHKSKWLLSRNEEDKESHCHACGSRFATVRLRPFCQECSEKSSRGEDVFLI